LARFTQHWWKCICAGTDGATREQQQLARLNHGIVGTWVGAQTNPWNAGAAFLL
jgi:hypothetical protein